MEGPFTPKPQITTGAGDHFNYGFCLGKLLGLPTEKCLLTGVATSGFYVRSAQSRCYERLLGAHIWEMSYENFDDAVRRLERLVDFGD